MWFASTTQPPQRYKVASALAENVSTKVIGIVPALPAGEYGIEIVTRYAASGVDLKEPNTIKSGFTLRAL